MLWLLQVLWRMAWEQEGRVALLLGLLLLHALLLVVLGPELRLRSEPP